jgi:hypothetical protein
VYVTVDPNFFKPGILYNQQFIVRSSDYKYEYVAGVYGKVQYGNINPTGLHADNLKGSLGVSLVAFAVDCRLFLGGNYNYFYNVYGANPFVDINRVHPVSFEWGVSKILDRWEILMINDPINWETSLGVTYKFNHLR